MSKELDDKIDGAITSIIDDARTPISLSNGRAKLRSAQEVALTIARVLKQVNKSQEVTEAKLDELEKALEAEIAKGET